MDEATDGIVWLKEIQKANITCEEFQMQSSVPYNEVGSCAVHGHMGLSVFTLCMFS